MSHQQHNLPFEVRSRQMTRLKRDVALAATNETRKRCKARNRANMVRHERPCRTRVIRMAGDVGIATHRLGAPTLPVVSLRCAYSACMLLSSLRCAGTVVCCIPKVFRFHCIPRPRRAGRLVTRPSITPLSLNQRPCPVLIPQVCPALREAPRGYSSVVSWAR